MKQLNIILLSIIFFCSCKATELPTNALPGSSDLNSQVPDIDYNECRTNNCPTLDIETNILDGDTSEDGSGLLATEGVESSWKINANVPLDTDRRVRIFLDAKPDGLQSTFTEDFELDIYEMELKLNPQSSDTQAAIFILRDMKKCLHVEGADNYNENCKNNNTPNLAHYDQKKEFYFLVDENEKALFEELQDERDDYDKCLRRTGIASVASKFLGGIVGTIAGIFANKDC